MIREAIILAGGLGTRLQSEVKDVPKPMAPIEGRPYLEYLMDNIINQGIQTIIFSVGYMYSIIQNHFGGNYRGCEIVYAVEKERLGTGGAIRFAMSFAKQKELIVLNGDSMFLCDIQKQYELHLSSKADVTLAVKPMSNFDRYGTVRINQQGRIQAFKEKAYTKQGYVNMGMYIFASNCFEQIDMPENFSIEKDFFEANCNELNFQTFTSSAYFLDIGIPEDFKRAQYEIGIFSQLNKDWTLFLDRDGVINKKRDNDYVKNIDEFEWLSGAPEAVAKLSVIFGRAVVVTNQQGVGKGLMSMADVEEVHAHITDKVESLGGHIDAFYVAPQLKEENSNLRKPEIGMALKAREQFQDINFSKSIMIGDSESDMLFAEKAGMVPIYITNKKAGNYYFASSLSSLVELILSTMPDHYK